MCFGWNTDVLAICKMMTLGGYFVYCLLLSCQVLVGMECNLWNLIYRTRCRWRVRVFVGIVLYRDVLDIVS